MRPCTSCKLKGKLRERRAPRPSEARAHNEQPDVARDALDDHARARRCPRPRITASSRASSRRRALAAWRSSEASSSDEAGAVAGALGGGGRARSVGGASMRGGGRGVARHHRCVPGPTLDDGPRDTGPTLGDGRRSGRRGLVLVHGHNVLTDVIERLRRRRLTEGGRLTPRRGVYNQRVGTLKQDGNRSHRGLRRHLEPLSNAHRWSSGAVCSGTRTKSPQVGGALAKN